MGKLRDIVSDEGKRQQVVAEAIQLVDAEVSDKGGLSGIAIKGAYAMVKGVAPGIMNKLMNGLLDPFLDALEPFYDEAKQKSIPVKTHFVARQSDVANALLGITDQRAQQAGQGTLKKGYEKLRPTAQKHTEQAVPRLGEFVEKLAG
jgi:hypothetical protein